MSHILCAIHDFIDIDHKPEWSLSNVYFLGHRLQVYSGFFLSYIGHSLPWSFCIISSFVKYILWYTEHDYLRIYLNEVYALKKACEYTLKIVSTVRAYKCVFISFILVFEIVNERNLLFSSISTFLFKSTEKYAFIWFSESKNNKYQRCSQILLLKISFICLNLYINYLNFLVITWTFLYIPFHFSSKCN